MITLFIITLVFSISISHSAEFELEKTFTHDNTYCQISNESIEIEIRSKDQYSRMEDSEFGEFVVLKDSGKVKVISMNKEGIGRYRLVKGSTPECTKALNLRLDEDRIVVFLAKENRPFGDTLSLLYLNLKNGDKHVINTKYRSKNEKIINDILEFQEAANVCANKTDSANIDKISYLYTQKDFEPIMNFNGKDFSVDTKKTFSFYNRDLFFKSEKDFYMAKGNSQTVLNAVNFEYNRKCISFDGHSWHCLNLDGP